MSRKSHRRMKKGGLFEGITSGWNSMTTGASSWFGSKKPTSSSSSSTYSTPTYSTPTSSTTTSTTSTYTPPTTVESTPSTESSSTYSSTTSSALGGTRKRRRGRGKRGGGCSGTMSYSSLAENAAPISDSRTAQAKWVGGAKRTKRHNKKRSSSRRHK
jgi:hypothetical protein